MRDYEELVNRLRAGTYTVEELSIILPKAADAIEELQKRVELEYQSGFADGQRSANRKRNKWISVEDALPKKGTVVLAFGTRSATTGMFQGVGKAPWFWWWKGHTIKRVTHWMPLPEPPKEAPHEL